MGARSSQADGKSSSIKDKREDKSKKKRSKRASKLTTRRKKTPVAHLLAQAESRKIQEAVVFQ